MFQSPSLRGSGRFASSWDGSPKGLSCFNPLHCGAVVASITFFVARDSSRHVSIPFIAGQWSLLLLVETLDIPSILEVSIPFIAGQWSLQIDDADGEE